MKYLCLIGLLSACSMVGTGQIGIERNFYGQVQDTPQLNTIVMTILSSLVKVDGTQIRNLVSKIKAKDSDGVLFSEIDVQAIYTLKPEGAVRFYKQTLELDCVKENPSNIYCENVLGFELIKQELTNATVKAFSKFKASDVNVNKPLIEDEVKKTLTERLETRYKDVFVINNININSAQLDPTVERVLQSQALLDSEKRLIGAKIEIQKQQNDLLKMEIEELKRIAVNAGVSVSDLLKYRNDKERNKVLSELAKTAPNTQVQIKE